MNPAEIAELLSKDDVLFLLEEIINLSGNKTEIARNLGIERKTIYNLKDTKDISLELKEKIVEYYILNRWTRMYGFMADKLESKLAEVILDVLMDKWTSYNETRLVFKRKTIALEMEDMMQRFHPILKKAIPERYGTFLESISFQFDAPSIYSFRQFQDEGYAKTTSDERVSEFMHHPPPKVCPPKLPSVACDLDDFIPEPTFMHGITKDTKQIHSETGASDEKPIST